MVSSPVKEALNTDTIFVDKLIHKRVTREKMLDIRVGRLFLPDMTLRSGLPNRLTTFLKECSAFIFNGQRSYLKSRPLTVKALYSFKIVVNRIPSDAD